jgi:hypothetical protein
MPSNRSKKDIFHKDADDTLKRQLISSEFRKYIVLFITGKEAHNGADALLVTSSSQEYIELENFYNKRLASHITSIRYEIVHKVKNRDYDLPDEGLNSNADNKSLETEKAKEDKIRNKDHTCKQVRRLLGG